MPLQDANPTPSFGGFGLSFTAVAGIALLTTSGWRPWTYFFESPYGGGGWWRVLLSGLVLAVAVSVVATLATLPLIAFNFQRLPTLGVLTTVLALTALPVLLLTSAAAAVAGIIHPMAGQVVGWLAWIPLEYILRLVQLLSRVPGSTISLPPFSGLLVWAYYVAFAMLFLIPGGLRGLWTTLSRLVAGWRARQLGRDARGRPLRFPLGAYLTAIVVLGALAGFLWFHTLTGPDGKLHVHFLDVGQGDSIFIVTPEGKQILVDGGPAPIGAARALGQKTPFWDRDLDMAVLTHPDEDHFRGLVEVLDRYDVGTVLEGGGVSENPLFLEWDKVLDGTKARRVAARQGQTVNLDAATRLEVLNPPDRTIGGVGSNNNNGAVLRLVYGEVSFLLTADIEAEAEGRLLREGPSLRSTVLKVPHHGSKTSTTPRFLAAVSPTAVVISAGADNRFGHPHPEVVARLEAMPGRDATYLTADRGDIEFITDGERLWVKTER